MVKLARKENCTEGNATICQQLSKIYKPDILAEVNNESETMEELKKRTDGKLEDASVGVTIARQTLN